MKVVVSCGVLFKRTEKCVNARISAFPILMFHANNYVRDTIVEAEDSIFWLLRRAIRLPHLSMDARQSIHDHRDTAAVQYLKQMANRRVRSCFYPCWLDFRLRRIKEPRVAVSKQHEANG